MNNLNKSLYSEELIKVYINSSLKSSEVYMDLQKKSYKVKSIAYPRYYNHYILSLVKYFPLKIFSWLNGAYVDRYVEVFS